MFDESEDDEGEVVNCSQGTWNAFYPWIVK